MPPRKSIRYATGIPGALGTGPAGIVRAGGFVIIAGTGSIYGSLTTDIDTIRGIATAGIATDGTDATSAK